MTYPYFSAKEIAAAGVRLKIEALPHSKRGVQDHIDRFQWASSPLCQKRKATGGGIEYHVSLLPEALQSALHGEQTREIVTVNQQEKKAKEIARREKLSTADLTARQRDVMNARSSILSCIDTYQIANGMSQRQAIQAFLSAPEASGASTETLARANDRASGKATVSRATLYEWFKLRDTVGVGALAPLITKEQHDIPSWFWNFFRLYAQPSKPCLSDTLSKYNKGLPAQVMPPNYDQVRR